MPLAISSKSILVWLCDIIIPEAPWKCRDTTEVYRRFHKLYRFSYYRLNFPCMYLEYLKKDDLAACAERTIAIVHAYTVYPYRFYIHYNYIHMLSGVIIRIPTFSYATIDKSDYIISNHIFVLIILDISKVEGEMKIIHS